MADSGLSAKVLVPKFEGKDDEFQVYWMRLRAHAAMAGFSQAINRTQDPDLPAAETDVIDETTDIGKKQMKAKKANLLAMATLTTSFRTQALIGLCYKAMTSEWPGGLAWKVVDGLFEKYAPKDLISKVELRRELAAVKMGKKDDPRVLFETLAAIENKYNHAKFTIEKDELIATVLENAPMEYASVLTSEQRRRAGNLDLMHLQDAMTQLYRTMYGRVDCDTSKEVQLSSFETKGGIVCYRCKKPGHKAYECPEKKKGDNGGGGKKKFRGNCHRCGKQGHRQADCWEDPKNKHKKEEFMRKKGNKNAESGFASHDKEIVLSMIDELDQYDLCEEPNIGESRCYPEWEFIDDEEEEDEVNGLMDGDIPEVSLMTIESWYDSDDETDGSYTPIMENRDGKSCGSSYSDAEISMPGLMTRGSMDDDSSSEEEDDYVDNDSTNSSYDEDINSDWTAPTEEDDSNWSDEGQDPNEDDDDANLNLIQGEIKYMTVTDDEHFAYFMPYEGSHDVPVGLEWQENQEIALTEMGVEFPRSLKFLEDPNVFVADTGASVDSTGWSDGLFEVEKAGASDSVTASNGDRSKTQSVGSLKGIVCNKSGKQLYPITMKGVKHVPNSKFNLFSVTKRLKDGWKLHGDKHSMWLEKKDMKVVFDIRVDTKEGCIFAIYIKRNEGSELNALEVAKDVPISVAKAHSLFGHMDENRTREVARHLGYRVVRGSMTVCEPCAVAKAKQKNLPQVSERKKSVSNGELIYLDISSIKPLKDGPTVNAKRHWRMMVDDRTGLSISQFYETKSGMIGPTCSLWNVWKEQLNITVKRVRMDNAGENRSLEKCANGEKWKMGIDFSYTARDTPQQNSLVERRFATSSNRGRALLAEANVPQKERYMIGYRAMSCADKLDGLTIVEIDGKTATRYEHFYGTLPKWARHLRTWGEAGTVKLKTRTTPKLNDRGATCMFVDYTESHEGDCYFMWDPERNILYTTRDIIWLKRMYFSKPTEEEEAPITLREDDKLEQDQKVVSFADEVQRAIAIDGAATIQHETEQNEPEAPEDDESEDEDVDTEGELEQHDNRPVSTSTRSGRAVRAPLRYIQESEEMGTTNFEAEDPYEIQLTPAEEKFYAQVKELNELSLL